MSKKYLLYLIRWQLSTPILAVCVVWLASLGTTWATIIANFIGGLIFFWVDKWIFNRNKIPLKDMNMIFEYMRKVLNTAPEIRLECLNKKEKQTRLERVYDSFGNLGIEFEDMMDKWSESTKRRWFNHINAPYKDAIRKCIKRQKKEKSNVSKRNNL